MSKPDAASGSLENILASIRKSLSEQATDAPSEAPAAAAEPPKEASGGRKGGGLRQRLAGATGDAAGDDLADMLDEQAAAAPQAASAAAASPPPAVEAAPEAKATVAAAPAAAPAATEIKPPQEDPLWFLTRRDDPAEVPSADAGGVATPAAEPILTRPEVVRASMPPFFGSAAEAAKPEPSPPANDRQQWPAAVVAPQPDAGAAKVQPTGANASLNGRTGHAGEVPVEAAAVPGGIAAPAAALEAVVLDLLKPMLRQWLDQNMPRLVAEALKGEAQRVRGPDSGTKA